MKSEITQARRKTASVLVGVSAPVQVKPAEKGQKGQKSRSGVSLLGFEGGQMPLYRRLPKRGFNNPFTKDFAELTTGKLQKAIDAGHLDAKKAISSVELLAAGVVRKSKTRDGVPFAR